MPKSFALLLAVTGVLFANSSAAQPSDPAPLTYHEECEEWDEWEKPAEPFRVFGNTYYVGTCGIAAILITGEDRHALIDTGTEGGANIVLANIRKLGFDPADITILLASHEHFDHVGGMAKVQRATGASVIASEIAIDVMASGEAHPDDPQFGMHDPMMPIEEGMPWFYGDAPYLLDYFGISPIETPGHTLGAMSWRWQSCEGELCRSIVYADSLSAVSADEYRFTDHPKYVAAFRASLARVAALDCDILLTPHPSGSLMRGKTLSGNFDLGTDCESYAERALRRLEARLEKEAESE